MYMMKRFSLDSSASGLALIRRQLGMDDEKNVLHIPEESEFSLAIRLHERDLTDLFISRILENGFTRESLALVWHSLPALLNWIPTEAEKLLEAFVVDPPFHVPELKAYLNPASRLISKGTEYFGYQINVWQDYLEGQENGDNAALEPMMAKVVAIPEMVSGDGGDGQGLLTLLMEHNAPSSFYASTPARILIDYKWETFARDELQMYFVSYVIFLASYTIFALQLRERESAYKFGVLGAESGKGSMDTLEHYFAWATTLIFFAFCSTYRYLDARFLGALASPVSAFFPSSLNSMSEYITSSSCWSCLFRGSDADDANSDEDGDHDSEEEELSLLHSAAGGGSQFSGFFSPSSSTMLLLKRHAALWLPLVLFFGGGVAMPLLYNRPDLLNTIVLTVILCYTLRSVVDEGKELSQKSPSAYFFSVWNMFDIVLVILNVLTFIAYLDAAGHTVAFLTKDYLITGVTISVLMAWMKLFYFCQPFRNIGSFIRMLIEIFVDIRYFLIVVSIALLGFGTAFYVLYKDDPQPYPDRAKTLLSVYVTMLGDWNVEHFTDTQHPLLATILFCIFTFVMVIILFNLLIAIMSDTFERVRENEENTFLRTRADMICDLQKLSFRKINYLPWVHALLPAEKDASGHKSHWKGKLGEIKDLIKGLKQDFARDLETQLQELEENLRFHEERGPKSLGGGAGKGAKKKIIGKNAKNHHGGGVRFY
ncbi:unnamed protein product [Amoebophrya sp. A25]|nr:unnamed protein product [Amoebophrya sp. A25]|eukprot:GSA25T00004793001.1